MTWIARISASKGTDRVRSLAGAERTVPYAVIVSEISSFRMGTVFTAATGPVPPLPAAEIAGEGADVFPPPDSFIPARITPPDRTVTIKRIKPYRTISGFITFPHIENYRDDLSSGRPCPSIRISGRYRPDAVSRATPRSVRCSLKSSSAISFSRWLFSAA